MKNYFVGNKPRENFVREKNCLMRDPVTCDQVVFNSPPVSIIFGKWYDQ
jgi:hypothetical protein